MVVVVLDEPQPKSVPEGCGGLDAEGAGAGSGVAHASVAHGSLEILDA